MLHKKIAQKRLAIILGGIIGSAGIGLLMTFAVFDTTQEIPDTDTGTIGYALSKIIAGNWQTGSGVQRSKQLGGVDGEKYLRLTGTGGCSNLNQALRSISPDGTSVQCETIVTTRDRPILATIRDLDSSCAGAVSITNTGTYIDGSGNPQAQRTPQTYTVSNSDPIDLYEDDTIETTTGCSLASLYMPDNSIIRLSASTKITLRYAGIPGGSGATSTDLDGGEMWARVLKPITDDSYFNINTQEASVGVRGTSVWIKRDSGITTALPIDSGKLTATDIASNSGAIIVYPKHGDLTALGTPVAITHTITVDADGKSQLTPYSTSTTTKIYQDKPFVRMATLADIKDFKALQKNVGNLATIKVTKSELTTTLRNTYDHDKVDESPNKSQAPSSDSIIDTEISRTLPSNNDERSALCLGLSFGGDNAGTATSSSPKQWWDAVPLGRTNCIESGISFLADYSKNDSNLYGVGLQIGMQNIGSPSADNGSILIDANNEYIRYLLPGNDYSILSGRKITISLQNAIPTGGGNKYILDLGSYYKVFRNSITGAYQCSWRTDQNCNLTPEWSVSPDSKTIIVKIPTPLEIKNAFVLPALPSPPTQLIFGNLYNPAVGNHLKLPIGTTLQSINISPPTSGGS